MPAPTISLLLAAALAAAEPGSPLARHEAALALMLDGRLAEAALAFDAVAADPATPPPLAERARALAEASRALDARGRFVLRVEPLSPAAPGAAAAGTRAAGPRLDRRGRGELALYATAYGIWTGVATGVLVEADDPKAFAALALAGGGAGLAIAVTGTRSRPMPDGRTQAIEAGGNWGSLNGGLIGGLLDAGERGTAGTTLLGGLAGIAGTVAATSRRSPSSGDVAVSTSGAMWGLATGALALTFLHEPSDEVVLATLLGATDAGLLGMSLAARRIEISRGRSLLIDAGGLVGALAGLSIPFFLESEEPAAYGAAGLAGLALGLGSTVRLTRRWDEGSEAARADAGPRAFPWVRRPTAGEGLVAGLGGSF